MPVRRIIETSEAPVMPVPISQAVVHGSTLYVGGQAGFDPRTREVVSDRFDEQLRQALTNLRVIVEAGGSQLTLALKVTVYVARIEDYAALNAIYASSLRTSHPPARWCSASCSPAFLPRWTPSWRSLIPLQPKASNRCPGHP